MHKVNDKFKLEKVKKNIVKVYIIGQNINYFKKQIGGALEYTLSFNIENALQDIIKDLFLLRQRPATILLSPASASYDQFDNFVERGDHFKKMTLKYARKFI